MADMCHKKGPCDSDEWNSHMSIREMDIYQYDESECGPLRSPICVQLMAPFGPHVTGHHLALATSVHRAAIQISPTNLPYDIVYDWRVEFS